MKNQNIYWVEAWGEFGCFTRPDLKTDAVSYPCPTPTACEGILRAVYGKVQFHYEIHEIVMLSEPSFVNYKTRMTKNVVSVNNVKDALSGLKASPVPVEPDLRGGLYLMNPRFAFSFSLVVDHHMIDKPEYLKLPEEQRQHEYEKQMLRRYRKGQFHYRPCMGRRECAANVEMLSDSPSTGRIPDYWMFQTHELGMMPHYAEYPNGYPDYRLFDAKVEDGVLTIPPRGVDRVLAAVG